MASSALDEALCASDNGGLPVGSLHRSNPNFHPNLTTEHLATSCGRDDKDGTLYFYNLRAALVARSAVWTGPTKTGKLFRVVEQGGEAGEVADAILPLIEHIAAVGRMMNTAKKLHREEQGWAGSRTTKEALGKELADSVITAYNTAHEYDIDLDATLIDKFNETSDKVGIKVKLIDGMNRRR